MKIHGILGALEKSSTLGTWLAASCMDVRGYRPIPLYCRHVEGTVDRFWPETIADHSSDGVQVIKFEGSLPDEAFQDRVRDMGLEWTPYLDLLGDARGDLMRSLLIYDDWELRSVTLATGQPRWSECRVEFGE